MADVLVFGAHPDDAEFGMGASIVKFVRCGVSVALCVLTRGEAGTFGTPRQREEEMRRAAAKLDIPLDILDFQDCHVTDSFEARAALAAVIRARRPKIVFAPYFSNPGSHLDGGAHPDHIATGLIVKSAARYARFSGLRDIPGEPWNANHLLYYMVPRGMKPSLLNDVTADMEEWESVARCHESQMNLRNGQLIEALRRFRVSSGIMINVAYAEAFLMEEPVTFDMRTFLAAPAGAAVAGSAQGVQEKAGCPDVGE
jgi:N-acetylglucosamine malate deacetylase 1